MDQVFGSPISLKVELFLMFCHRMVSNFEVWLVFEMFINIFLVTFLCLFKVGDELCLNVYQPHGLIFNYKIHNVIHTLNVKFKVQIMICKSIMIMLKNGLCCFKQILAWTKIWSIILMIIGCAMQILLLDLIDPFYLSIHLGVEGW
jgi:membrane-associated PAP2 superfamily phosphatase